MEFKMKLPEEEGFYWARWTNNKHTTVVQVISQREIQHAFVIGAEYKITDGRLCFLGLEIGDKIEFPVSSTNKHYWENTKIGW